MCKLSIVIPVYNVEPYVCETLESVFNTSASKEDFEVIIVNDGTKDGSMEVVRRFLNRSNLTILEQENRGLSAARNLGLDQADGEYVWFVDSDDWLVEDGVGKVLGLLEERPGVEVIMTPLLRRDSRRTNQDRLDYQIAQERVLSGKEALRSAVIPSYGWIMRFVFLRSFLISNYWLRFPVGLMHEDTYMGTAAMYSAKHVSILPEPIYVYRVYRAGSILSSSTVERASDRLEIYRRLMVFMKKKVDPSDWEWFQSYCFYGIPFCYDKRLFDQKDFQVFARSNGGYIYRQWLEMHPKASIFTRIGRYLFFTRPELYRKIRPNRNYRIA